MYSNHPIRVRFGVEIRSIPWRRRRNRFACTFGLDGEKEGVVSRRANGKRFLSIWVGVNGFGHRQTPFYPGPRLEKRLCSKWMGGGTRNSFAGKCPRNDASRWVDGEDLAEIFAGIETPSFFSRLRRARPCSTCRIDSPRIQISFQPGIWFHRISRARILFYQGEGTFRPIVLSSGKVCNENLRIVSCESRFFP